MPESSRIPPPPRQSPYGWPLLDRREEFRKLTAQPVEETFRVEGFKGGMVSRPIMRVPLNLPKYRISNGRTASAQLEWVSSKNLQADFFDEGDPELEEVQLAQHQILRGMVKDAGLLEKFKDSANKQVEPIILDENGFVVNGNRRLCCWRLLYENDPQKYSHFGHIDVVVLPHCDEKELDRLEARLQIEEDIRSDYTWDAEANMLAQKQRLHGFTTLQLAKLYGKKKKEIEDLLAMRPLAAEYLVSRGNEHAWSEVKGDKHAFQELLKARNNTATPGDREIVKQAAFALIDDSDETGRLYAVIPKVREHLDAVKESLAEVFPIPEPEEDPVAQEAFGSPTPAQKGGAFELALVAEIKKDTDSVRKARSVVIETIRSQDEQSKERDAADFLFKTLKRANGLLQTASGYGLRPECAVGGVSAQLDAIKTAIERIEAWLAERRS